MAYNNSVSSVTGHTPYFLNFGRRARLPVSKLLGRDDRVPLLDNRLHDVADALRTAASATQQARHYNRERLARQANMGQVNPGDTVILKANEPLTLTSSWDPQWTVTKVRGKVVWINHAQTGKQKVVNVNKVKLVDPNIVWDSVNPRPIRNPHKPARVTHDRTHPPPHQSAPHPRPIRTRQAPKRRRASSESSQDSFKGPPPPLQSHSSSETLDTTPAAPQRTTATSRPAPQDFRDTKRLHRQANRRQLPQDQDTDIKRPHRRGITRPAPLDQLPPSKRQRPLLHRAAKRPLLIDPPSIDIQKKARISAIVAVARITSSPCLQLF
jgi:hypothetical protein